jgi:hypothetical protein
MVFLYLNGFRIIKCGFFYLVMWIYCVFSISSDYICRSTKLLKQHMNLFCLEFVGFKLIYFKLYFNQKYFNLNALKTKRILNLNQFKLNDFKFK